MNAASARPGRAQSLAGQCQLCGGSRHDRLLCGRAGPVPGLARPQHGWPRHAAGLRAGRAGGLLFLLADQPAVPPPAARLFLYRGTEVVILLIILKFFTELRAGPASFWNNFLLWPVDFPFNLLNWHFISDGLAVLAAWWAGILFAADLALLGADDDAFPDERLKTATVRALIQRRFLRLGLLVVFPGSHPRPNRLAAASAGGLERRAGRAGLLCAWHHPAQSHPLHQPGKYLDAGQAQGAHPRRDVPSITRLNSKGSSTSLHVRCGPADYCWSTNMSAQPRFRWTETQIRTVNGLLSIFSSEMRMTPDGIVKPLIEHLPDAFFEEVDPSEAVRSAEVMVCLEQRFDFFGVAPMAAQF